MTTRSYITRQGDTLDLIARKHYGYERGTTEILYSLNPSLLDYDTVLPDGIEINLPDVDRSKNAIQEVVTLWD